MALRKLQLPTVDQDGAKVTGATLKSVFRSIDDHCGENGSCWASVDVIAHETCLSDKTVRRSIRALVRLGYISENDRKARQTGTLKIDREKVSSAVTITARDGNRSAVMPTLAAVMPTVSAVILTQSAVTVTGKAIETRRNEKKRDLSSKLRFDDEDLLFSKWMFEKVKTAVPKISAEPNFEKWANQIRITRESDKRSIQELREVFDWANQDDFWSTNIQSPSALRKHFATLHKKINSKQVGKKLSVKDFGFDTAKITLEVPSEAIAKEEKANGSNATKGVTVTPLVTAFEWETAGCPPLSSCKTIFKGRKLSDTAAALAYEVGK